MPLRFPSGWAPAGRRGSRRRSVNTVSIDLALDDELAAFPLGEEDACAQDRPWCRSTPAENVADDDQPQPSDDLRRRVDGSEDTTCRSRSFKRLLRVCALTRLQSLGFRQRLLHEHGRGSHRGRHLDFLCGGPTARTYVHGLDALFVVELAAAYRSAGRTTEQSVEYFQTSLLKGNCDRGGELQLSKFGRSAGEIHCSDI